MAYTLKSSGIALNLIVCVVVDEDGTTITDLTGKAITLGTGVSASVATGSWKSVSRKYFSTTANGTFDFNGVTWNTAPLVDEDDSDGVSVWCAFHGASSANTVFAAIAGAPGDVRGYGKAAATAKGTYRSGGTTAATTTDLPTDGTTKFSFGMAYRSGVSSEAFYGLESGNLSSEDTEASDGGFGGDRNLYEIGGVDGQGNHPASVYCFCVFNKMLSETEMDSLHDDWFGTLIDAGGSPPAAPVFRRSLLGAGM